MDIRGSYITKSARTLQYLEFNYVVPNFLNNKIIASTNTNIYNSTNNGNYWNSLYITSNITSLASSTDGTKIIACINNGYIYTSINSGVNWTQRSNAGSRSWSSVASSSNGTILAASVNNGYIYTSIDSGVNWIEQNSIGPCYWKSIAFYSDGSKLVACVYGGNIYILNMVFYYTNSIIESSANSAISTFCKVSENGKVMMTNNNSNLNISNDYGLTWRNLMSLSAFANAVWNGAVVSLSGEYILVCNSNISYYYSNDSGVNFTRKPDNYSGPLVASSDISKIFRLKFNDYLYISTNYGQSWTALTSLGKKNFSSIACSSDGTKIATCGYSNNGPIYIYTSSDSGANWIQRTSAGNRNWSNLVCSSNGTIIIACVSGGYVYISTDSGVNWTERINISNILYLSCSYDGTKIAALKDTKNLYISDDLGVSWTNITEGSDTVSNVDGFGLSFCLNGKQLILFSNVRIRKYNLYYKNTFTVINSNNLNWQSIQCSSNGTLIIACVLNEYVYISTDSGTTWTQQTSLGIKNWKSVACSSSGTKMAACADNDKVYIYTNSTWTPVSSVKNWISVSISTTSDRVTAVASNSYVYSNTI
jgi:hypothetical protein